MKAYSKMTKEELTALRGKLEKQFEEVKAKGLKLDMSRGKPSKEQLDLSVGMMDVLTSESDLTSVDGYDCRNYGVLDGIPEARMLLAEMSEVAERDINYEVTPIKKLVSIQLECGMILADYLNPKTK